MLSLPTLDLIPSEKSFGFIPPFLYLCQGFKLAENASLKKHLQGDKDEYPGEIFDGSSFVRIRQSLW